MSAGSGRLAALIGSPVGHSLSPAIHRAGFESTGTDWSYAAFDVPEGRADRALDAMRTLGIGGYSVTTPHKEQVAQCVDELEPAAAQLSSVNTVVNDSGRLTGYSTDGDGFVAALAAAGVDVAGLRVLVLGAGAAARSVVAALARARAAAIVVTNRTPERLPTVVDLAPVARPVLDPAVLDVEAAAAELIVNATSVGFGAPAGDSTGESADDPAAVPLDPALLHGGHLVADLVYHPLETPLLRAAAAVGAATFDGLGMLIHQAVLQQELWTGAKPDPSVMRAAAEAELARRNF